MSKRRVPRAQLLWERHVEGVLRVLRLALEKLHAEVGLPVAEKDLDQRLYLKARDVYHGLAASQRPQYFALVPKSEQAPVDAEDVQGEWLRKKPDFKWRMQDDLATTPQGLTRDLDIESKRLGRPTSSRWVLTERYVISGIVRFLSATHRYGNGARSGAMIGYVQDSEPVKIVREVNTYIRKRIESAIPHLSFPRDYRWRHGVLKCRQNLDRSQVLPSDFALHHLWVDLRRN